MIVARGFARAAVLAHRAPARGAAGYFFDVITNGFGAMSAYATAVPVRDRWAIAAYVRALQLSQHARPEDVPRGERARLRRHGRRAARAIAAQPGARSLARCLSAALGGAAIAGRARPRRVLAWLVAFLFWTGARAREPRAGCCTT